MLSRRIFLVVAALWPKAANADIRSEFQRGDDIIVNGWLLARSEAAPKA